MSDGSWRLKSRRALLKKGGIVASTVSIAGCATESNEGENGTLPDDSSTDKDSENTTDSPATSADDVTLHGFKPWNIVPPRGEFRDEFNYGLIYHNLGEYPSASSVPLINTGPDAILSDDGHFATMPDLGIGVSWDINVNEYMDLHKSYIEEQKGGSYSWEEKKTIGDYTLHLLINQDQHTVERIATKQGIFIQRLSNGRLTPEGFDMCLDSEPIPRVDSQISTMLRRLPAQMNMEIYPREKPFQINGTDTKIGVNGSSVNMDIRSGEIREIQLTYISRVKDGDPNTIFEMVESKEWALSSVTDLIDHGDSSFERTVTSMSMDSDFVTVEASYTRK